MRTKKAPWKMKRYLIRRNWIYKFYISCKIKENAVLDRMVCNVDQHDFIMHV